MSTSKSPASTRSTYERILYAAAECMYESGYQQARMTTIAEKTGISRAALYKYFPTKDSLLLELHQKALEVALAESQALTESTQPALEVIRESLVKYLNADQMGFISAVLLEDAQQVLLLGEEFTEEVINDLKKSLTRLIRRGIKEGDIRKDIKPADMAHTLLGFVHSIKRNDLSTRPIIDLSAKRYRSLLIETMLAGISAS